MTAAPNQRPDDALIREARNRPRFPDPELVDRLADALEQRIAEGVEAYAVRDVADEKRYAAEDEVQRLRDAEWKVSTRMMNDLWSMEKAHWKIPDGCTWSPTLTSSFVQKMLPIIRAALRPNSEGGGGLATRADAATVKP